MDVVSSVARRVHYSYEEYLRLEESSATKHEYLDGEMYAMAGGTPDHAALAAAMIGILRGGLPSNCRVFTSDLRVRMPETGLSTYPDAAVICGTSVRADDDRLAVVNPVLLIEVTSPSTEEYDRGEKLRHYQSLPSLREVLIVSHREPRVTLVSRRDGGRWSSRDVGSGETITLATIDPAIAIAIDDLYRDGLEDR
jgi:Uma2 family endonuclease